MKLYFVIFTISLILLIFLAGCSFNNSTADISTIYHDSGDKQKTQRGSVKMPPTQRPYTIREIKYYPLASAKGYVKTGIASWYGKKFHGRKTSNGETYNMYAVTAAHKTLPMNTLVLVHNLENNRKLKLRINDRGPFVPGRIIDLSYTAAKKLGIAGPGTAKVRVTALSNASAAGQPVNLKNSSDKAALSNKPLKSPTENFTLQVGAFKIKANALQYRDRLAEIYPDVHINTYEDHRGSFYRVRIGSFKNIKEAEKFCAELLKQNIFDSITVVPVASPALSF